MAAPLSTVHFTIGATPDGGVNLTKELRMLKAAILYADKVKLCSYTSSMVLAMVQLANSKPDQQIEFLEKVVPVIYRNDPDSPNVMQFIDAYKHLKRRRGKSTRQEVAQFSMIRSRLNSSWDSVRATVEKTAIDAGIDGLLDALNSGMVELHQFKVSDTEGATGEYFETVRNAVLGGATYPFLDAQSSNLVNHGIKEGRIELSESGAQHARHGSLVGSLMQRLPLFDDASVADILSIRQELEKPLVRFRSAIARFSDMIRSASWDSDFENDVNTLIMKEIDPVVLEIEESIKSNTYISQLSKNFVSKPSSILTSSSLGFIISNVSSLPEVISRSFAGLGITDINPSVTALGIGAGSAALAYDAYRDWRQQRSLIEKNQLYFYYKVRNELS